MAEHKHAAIIAKWIKDISRRVLCRTPDEFEWEEDQYPCWHEKWEYCFADSKVSSLTAEPGKVHMKIKQLEWFEYKEGMFGYDKPGKVRYPGFQSCAQDAIRLYAISVGLTYQIDYDTRFSKFYVVADAAMGTASSCVFITICLSLEEATAAAQADYEKRIMSAFEEHDKIWRKDG